MLTPSRDDTQLPTRRTWQRYSKASTICARNSNPRYLALTAAPQDRTVASSASLKRSRNTRLENNLAIGLDCMDRLGIRGEVAAREGDRTDDDPRSYVDSDRVWRATPAVIL